MKMNRVKTDILVIGGGMAGWMASAHVKEAGLDVIIVDKGFIGKAGQSPYASNLYAYDPDSGKSVDEVVRFVHHGGEFLTNMEWSKIDIINSAKVPEELEKWGIELEDLTPGSNILGGIFYEIKGAGRFADSYEHTFGYKARKHLEEIGVSLYDRVMITDLMVQDGRVCGAVGFSEDDGEILVFEVAAVIMCTGGAGMKAPGYPMVASSTGDGLRMAYELGGELLGMEFPQAMRSSAENPAILRGRQPKGTSAKRLGSGRVTAGILHPFAWKAGGEPFVPQEGKLSGYGMSYLDQELLMYKGEGPVTYEFDGKTYHVTSGAALGMSVRKADGIWPADHSCRTSIPGLFAAGDALGTMQNGAIYTLGAGSISACASTGMLAGDSAAEEVKDLIKKKGEQIVSEKTVNEAVEKLTAPLNRKKGYSARWIIDLVQNLFMPYYVAYIQKADRLEAALTNLEYIRDTLLPNVLADNEHELRLAHEARSIVVTTEVRLRSALFRTESRGMHFREDYPYRDDENWLAWIRVHEGDDGMELEKVPVPEEWRPDKTMTYAEKYPYEFPGEKERGIR